METEKPTAGDNEVLVKVHAASVNPIDWHFMRGTPYVFRLMTGLRKPKIPRLGIDIAGVVEAIGKHVTKFKPGDEVFGSCRGAFAEYVCTTEVALVEKPENVTYEQAASVPIAAITALQGLRDKGHIQSGQRVLINGASGGVGTFAVQIAKSYEADVTGVCSTKNVEMVQSIGADRVIDYTREDFAKSVQQYDIVLDAIGNHPLSAIRHILSPEGTYVGFGGSDSQWDIGLSNVIKALVLSLFCKQNFVTFMAKLKKTDLTVLRDLILAGTVVPVIDRTYQLHEVPDAIRYLEQGHARGKVIIKIR